MDWYKESQNGRYAPRTLSNFQNRMPEVKDDWKKIEEQIKKDANKYKMQQMARPSQAPAEISNSYVARTLDNLPRSMAPVKDGKKKVAEEIRKNVDVNKGDVKMQQMARYKAVEGKPNQGAKEVKEKITEYKNLKNGERKMVKVVKKYY